MTDPSPASGKTELRARALTTRAGLGEEARAAAAAALAARPFPVAIDAGAVVAGYAAMRGELDPFPLMRALAARGARLALPVVAGSALPLVFRDWPFGAPLFPGAFGVREPSADAATVVPSIVLTPLAAFDRAGHRLGYGGGYYDRTLAALRGHRATLAIGLAFSVQEIPSVPSLVHDARLDLVLTEIETIDFRS